MRKLIECVPNFSEGRDQSVIDAITGQIETVDGVSLLDVDPGRATNRTVVTFVGSPDDVIEAAVRSIRTATELIDMSQHTGEHPRFGATDVCPLVPISGVTMEETVEYARRLARRLADEVGLSIYCYENAALVPERRNLADVRSGEYEGLAARLRGSRLEARFRPRYVQRPLRSHRRRRPQLPGRLQRQPQHHVDPASQRHRLRCARARQEEAHGAPPHRRGRARRQR